VGAHTPIPVKDFRQHHIVLANLDALIVANKIARGFRQCVLDVIRAVHLQEARANSEAETHAHGTRKQAAHSDCGARLGSTYKRKMKTRIFALCERL
jgi:hypothetical protein